MAEILCYRKEIFIIIMTINIVKLSKKGEFENE